MVVSLQQNDEMIDLQGVGKKYGEKFIHRDLSMKIVGGERLCVVGGSGVGKSVLMKLILGLEGFNEGEIYFEGVSLSNIDETSHFELMNKCGVVFQHAALFDSLTIAENIGLRLMEQGDMDPNELDRLVATTLKQVHLSEEVMDMLPEQLSGGMQKRVAIARAIIHKPRYLFYDEPTTGLDPENAAYIDELILELSNDTDTTSLVITHDLDTIAKVASHVAMFGAGGLVYHGEAQGFWDSPKEEVRAFLRRKQG